AAHLPLRDPHRVRGAPSLTDAHAWSVVEPSGRNGWQMQAEILDMKPGRTTAAHTHDLTMVQATAVPTRVLRTDNAARVPDGYISGSTRGHARALPTH